MNIFGHPDSFAVAYAGVPVNVLEVQRLIAALTAAGKQFEYKIYEDAPGGHHFNRIDTPLARQSRQEVYAFLAKYLKP